MESLRKQRRLSPEEMEAQTRAIHQAIEKEQNNKKNNIEEEKFKLLNEEGLRFLYLKLEVRKRKMAIEYCNALLNQIDNWEKHYESAKRCISRSVFYDYKIVESDLSLIEKSVFFWKVMAIELQNRPNEFLQAFPEKCHKYSEENFKMLYDYVLHSKHWWTGVTYLSPKPPIEDEETIMSALRDGYGDNFGF